MISADALALDPQGLDRLRFQAGRDNGKAAVREAAQQFESYFLQMMLRTMRQTLSQDGPFDSRETRMFSDMFDQQVAQNIAKGKGLGMADLLVSQLQQSRAEAPQQIVAPRPYNLPPPALPHFRSAPVRAQPGAEQAATAVESAMPPAPAEQPAVADAAPLTPHNFVDRLWPHAVEAAAELGVSPHFLLAQAALESGWGKHELRRADGAGSYNLFNIKAGSGWRGERVAAETGEYVSGRMETQGAHFRAYGSYAEAFADYVRLLKTNARYAGVVNQGADAEGFARGLQDGGYATDPMYADKILRVLNSSAFRSRLAGEAGAASQG